MKTIEQIIKQAEATYKKINKINSLENSSYNKYLKADLSGQIKGLYFASGLTWEKWNVTLLGDFKK
jgi:hypothetical protein